MTPPTYFLFAGEASGDQQGEKIVAALKRANPLACVYGVGGPKMRAAGLEPLLQMEDFQVMGFVDVFFALPRLLRAFLFLRKTLLKAPPDRILFIDYPGFSLALAKSLHKRKIKSPLYHYVCPSVWAWGKGRIPKMEKILEALFVHFPFESQFFDPKKLRVCCVGHPLVEEIRTNREPPLQIPPSSRVIALFPGSRAKEIVRNFPFMLEVAKELSLKHPDLLFALSVATPAFIPLLKKLASSSPLREELLFIDSAQNRPLMKRADLAIAKSGTNNLELALNRVPTFVIYGIGKMDLFIAKSLLKIDLPFYCLVNIIAGKEIFPEWIGPQMTKEGLLKRIEPLLSSEKELEEARKKCDQVGTILHDSSPEEEILREFHVSHEPIPVSDLH